MTPNELTTWLHGPLAEQLVLTLAHFLWQGSLVAGAVLLGSLIAGSSTRRRYAISVIGLVTLLLSPLATFFLLAPEAAPTATTSLPPAPTTGKFLEFNAVAPAYEDDLAHSESRGLLSQLSPWIFAAWMLGVAVFSTRLLLGIVSISWLKNSGESRPLAARGIPPKSQVSCSATRPGCSARNFGFARRRCAFRDR